MRQLSVAERARKMKEEASLDKKIEIAKRFVDTYGYCKIGNCIVPI